MQPGTLFLLEQAGELGKAEEPLLGCARLSFVRLAGSDYKAAVRGARGDDLRFVGVHPQSISLRNRRFVIDSQLIWLEKLDDARARENRRSFLLPAYA